LGKGGRYQRNRKSAERRQVTVMFFDLVGSTALAAQMDPEDLREIISAYQRCVADIVSRFDGFVAKYTGIVSSKSVIALPLRACRIVMTRQAGAEPAFRVIRPIRAEDDPSDRLHRMLPRPQKPVAGVGKLSHRSGAHGQSSPSLTTQAARHRPRSGPSAAASALAGVASSMTRSNLRRMRLPKCTGAQNAMK
jgi:class 3 adenylate cyclase